MMMKGTFYGIGVGPGDPDLLTLKAAKILHLVDVIAVPESKKEAGSVALEIAKPHLKSEVEMLTLTFPMIKDEVAKAKIRRDNALQIAEAIESGKNVAFLTLGDPMLYSTYIYLLETLVERGIVMVSVPGIYSFSAISNLVNQPLVKGDESLAVISKFEASDWADLQSFQTVVCMKVSAYSKVLFETLAEAKEWNFLMVTNAGKASEVTSRDIADLQLDVPYFSTVVLSKN